MQFSDELLCWYAANKRDLPWRKTKNPYFIWLSEIILQQTRVEQGLPYYLKFVKKYPTVKHLACAKEEEVLKLWQGLGYYTRARNLHHTAKIICNDYNEKFPDNYPEIISLKGVGKYTAAAIASLAFNQPFPVVDGNVQRVLARVFGIDDIVNSGLAEKKFYSLAGNLINKKDPGNFNQALMEFGAIHCTPANPKCHNCIFSAECIAFNTNRIDELPIKAKKNKVRQRFFHYLVIQKGKNLLINQRKQNDIWKNLYEFPLIETNKPFSRKEIQGSLNWKRIFEGSEFKLTSVSKITKHVLSHQIINTRFWEITIKKQTVKTTGLIPFLEIKKSELKKFPVSRLIEKYLAIKALPDFLNS